MDKRKSPKPPKVKIEVDADPRNRNWLSRPPLARQSKKQPKQTE